MKGDMIKRLKKLYYSMFKTYRRLEFKVFSYKDADILLKENEGKSEEEQWHLAKEEDTNTFYGYVCLERKVRVWE